MVSSIASSIMSFGLSLNVLAKAGAYNGSASFGMGLLGASWGLRCTLKCCTRADSSSILALLVLLLATLGRHAFEDTGSGLINYRKGEYD